MVRIVGIAIVFGAVSDRFMFGGRYTEAVQQVLSLILAHFQ
jgi:hypothetical protein